MNFLKGNYHIFLDLDGKGNGGGAVVSDSENANTNTNAEPIVSDVSEGESGSNSEPRKEESKAWMSQLPKEMQGNETLKGFNSIGELANAFLSKGAEQKKEPASFIINESQNEAEWENFDGAFDKSIDPNGTMTKALIGVAKENALTKEQVKAVIKSITDGNAESVNSFRENAPKMCKDVLMKQWGNNFNDNIKVMQKGFNKVVGDDKDFKKALSSSGLDNHPLVAELLRRVGTYFNEPNATTEKVEHNLSSNNPYGVDLSKLSSL